MSWDKVGDWLKDNAGTGVALVGSILTGNAPGAVAAGISLVSSATGTDNPIKALEQLQTNPETVTRLRELAIQDEENIRAHIREMHKAALEDAQKQHEEQQKTIRAGDTAKDVYVRHTRPLMARQSWYGTMGYIIAMELFEGLAWVNTGATWELAMILISPAAAYMGFRTWDKHGQAKHRKL